MGRERGEGSGFFEEEELGIWVDGGKGRERGEKEMKRLKHLEKRVLVSEKRRKG